MKKKIVGILVVMLLILTAIPAVGIMNMKFKTNDDVSKYRSASSDPLPDLEVWALDRDFKTFEAWFRNIGDADISGFTMHWYVDGDEIEEARKTYKWTLEPGEPDTEVENLAKYISSGWHTIEFCVNYGSVRINEITWDNNCMERTDYFLFDNFSTVDYSGCKTKIPH